MRGGGPRGIRPPVSAVASSSAAMGCRFPVDVAPRVRPAPATRRGAPVRRRHLPAPAARPAAHATVGVPPVRLPRAPSGIRNHSSCGHIARVDNPTLLKSLGVIVVARDLLVKSRRCSHGVLICNNLLRSDTRPTHRGGTDVLVAFVELPTRFLSEFGFCSVTCPSNCEGL